MCVGRVYVGGLLKSSDLCSKRDLFLWFLLFVRVSFSHEMYQIREPTCRYQLVVVWTDDMQALCFARSLLQKNPNFAVSSFCGSVFKGDLAIEAPIAMRWLRLVRSTQL